MIDAIRAYFESLFSGAYDRGTILVEFLLIGAVVYSVLRFLHGTRGARLFRGLVVMMITGFLAIRVLAVRFDWERISVLYQSFAWAVLLTVLVVFQPELRRGLMKVGETRWFRRYSREIDHSITVIANAAAVLSKSKIGAIIAIEREVPLGHLAENGVDLDARLSVDLLHTIFWPNSALHDMGVIVQRDRIVAAGVQFPLAEAGTLDRRFGSRHRAAVGLSSESDALVVVVSEETGTISLAEHGVLSQGISPAELAQVLRERLLGERARPPEPAVVRADQSDEQTAARSEPAAGAAVLPRARGPVPPMAREAKA